MKLFVCRVHGKKMEFREDMEIIASRLDCKGDRKNRNLVFVGVECKKFECYYGIIGR